MSTDPLKCKTLQDLPIGRIRELVEEEYGIRLADIDGWEQVENLREIVNAYKHRRGIKRFKDLSRNPETGGYDLKYDSSLTEADTFLKMVPKFLEALHAAVEAKSVDA